MDSSKSPRFSVAYLQELYI